MQEEAVDKEKGKKIRDREWEGKNRDKDRIGSKKRRITMSAIGRWQWDRRTAVMVRMLVLGITADADAVQDPPLAPPTPAAADGADGPPLIRPPAAPGPIPALPMPAPLSTPPAVDQPPAAR